MLTKITDFKGMYHIPNVTDTAPNSNLLGNSKEAMDYVDQYENECLDILLGIELSDLLRTELKKKPFNPDGDTTADQMWIDLVDGKEAYRGLKEALLAFVFHKYYEDSETEYTGSGERTIKTEMYYYAKMSRRATRVWRRYFELTIGNSVEATIYVRDIGIGVIHGESNSPYHSLYTFLKDNDTTYPEWEPTYFENTNQYGI